MYIFLIMNVLTKELFLTKWLAVSFVQDQTLPAQPQTSILALTSSLTASIPAFP